MERNARIASWIMASHLRLPQLVCIHTYRHKNIRTYLHRNKVIDVVKHVCLSVFCGGHVAVHLLWSTRMGVYDVLRDTSLSCVYVWCTFTKVSDGCSAVHALPVVRPTIELIIYSGITPFPCPEDVV